MPGTGPARNALGQGGGSPFAGAPRRPLGGNGSGAGISNARPARGRGRQPAQNGGRPNVAAKPRSAIGPQALPGPGGAQLERRVQSGKITQEEADRTMKQRQTLKAAFGPDWR